MGVQNCVTCESAIRNWLYIHMELIRLQWVKERMVQKIRNFVKKTIRLLGIKNGKGVGEIYQGKLIDFKKGRSVVQLGKFIRSANIIFLFISNVI